MRTRLSRTLIAVAFAFTVSTGAQAQAASLMDSLPGEVVPLDSLMRIAFRRAIALRLSRTDYAFSEAARHGANAVFDPQLSLSPGVANANGNTIIATGGTAGSVSRGGTLAANVGGVLPWTGAQYGVAFNSMSTYQNPISTNTYRTQYDNTMVLSLTQPLLRGQGGAGGRTQIEAQDDALRAAEARFGRAANLLVFSVEQAYYILAEREAEERVARASLDRARTLLTRNEELRRLDQIAEIDLIASRAGVASRESNLLGAIRNRRDAADQLLILVYGEDAPAALHASDKEIRTSLMPDDVPQIPTMDAAEAMAVSMRRDVLAAQIDVERQERLMDVARNGLLPNVGLSLGYTALASNTPGIQFTGERAGDFVSKGWNVGIALSYAMRNSAQRSQYESARAAITQAHLLLVSAQNAARADARAAQRAIEIGAASLERARAARTLATAQYDGEVERQKLGLSDSFRLLQIEDQESAAEITETGARFSLIISGASFRVAVGQDAGVRYGLSIAQIRP